MFKLCTLYLVFTFTSCFDLDQMGFSRKEIIHMYRCLLMGYLNHTHVQVFVNGVSKSYTCTGVC